MQKIDNKVQIIAEIGVNHNGNINKAKELALKAKKIGSDIVKFQLYDTDFLTIKDSRLCEYQSINSKAFKTQYDLLKKYEISYFDALDLINFCKENKIDVCFSCFDDRSIRVFKNKYIKYIKIPSGEINNYCLLKKISQFDKKIILSSGNSNLLEIKRAINLLNSNFKKNITVLHCVSSYPTKDTEINLNSIPYLRKKLKLQIGLSDHSTNINIPSLATAMGAVIIEKHITFNNNSVGPDHKSSLNIKDFKKMIDKIRNTELILGTKNKIIQNSEIVNKDLVRKHIVAKKSIKIGECFSEKNITTKRVGRGLPADLYFKVIGKKSKKKFSKDEIIIL